jgi:arylsulfatase A-like enzyme
MNTRKLPVVFTALSLGLVSLAYAGNAKHVVVLVWDGMRPDFVTEETTPTLSRLVKQGVFFQNHHSVFVSSTEVNGTALATGVHPHTSGIMANKEYRPAIDPLKSVAMEDVKTVREGDLVSHDRYLQVATVAEILRAQSPARSTTIAGTKPVAILLDRKERPEDSPSRLLVEGETLPASALTKITSALGAFPPINKTKIDRDTWTARALLEEFWADGVPPFSMLWLAEPDWSQHETGPGSPTSLGAIKSSDDKLAMVLKTLADRNVLDDTDVMIVSDHGFSTIERNADLALDLSKAGLTTARALAGKPSPGTVLVVGNGGSANLYVIGHDAAVIKRAVEFLQTQDYTGVLFTREAIPGTFPLTLAKIDTPDAPDIVISFSWTSKRSITGAPGLEVSEKGSGRGPGQGNHASLSRFDLHNTLIAAGPDFRKGIVNPLPSGNTDLAPTILWILGVPPPTPLDGRVLTEAMTIPGPKLQSFEMIRHEAANDLGPTVWRQYLTISEVNGVTYFDEGNGTATAK